MSFTDALGDWRAVEKNADELPALEEQLATLKERVAKDQEQLKAMKDNNASMFAKLHVPSGVKKLFSRGSSSANAAEHSGASFDSAYHQEASKKVEVEALEAELKTLESRVAAAKAIVAEADAKFETLQSIVDQQLPPEQISDSPPLLEALETLNSADQAYLLAHTISTDLARARTTAQHAHMYHKQVLQATDIMRDTPQNIMGSMNILKEVDKEAQHKAAIQVSVKAQACLAECLRVLKPHMHLVPDDVKPAIEDVETRGVAQVVKLYDIEYGGKMLDGDVRQQRKTLLERQDIPYADLTKIAVWLQNVVPSFEQKEQEKRKAQDLARRTVVSMWELKCSAPPPPFSA